MLSYLRGKIFFTCITMTAISCGRPHESITKSSAKSIALRRANVVAKSCSGNFNVIDQFSSEGDGLIVEGNKSHLIPVVVDDFGKPAKIKNKL